MSLLTRLRRRSIDKRLLLLISGLLIATVSAFWWTAHRQIERVAFSSAGERLLGAANSIRGILEDFTSRHALALQRVATDPEVVGFLRSGVGHDAALAKAVASLRAADLVRIQLRDARGRIVLESSPSGITQGSGWIERSIQMGGVAAGEVRVSPIWRDGQTPYSETLTGVAFHDSIPAAGGEAATPALIGYISEVRPIVAQGLDAVRELVGPEAVLLVGMPGEGEWTDLEVPSKPPPATARVGEALVFDSSAWGLGVGAAAAIRGTPWVLWVHQPRALILASIQPLMVAMASLAVFFIVVGAFCAWLLGRWISRPIVRLTKEAEQMAMSETTPSHAIDNNLDEIERLTEAFARMSARVQDSHDAMAASERRFRSLIENAADPITIVDADGKVLYASPAHHRVLGHPAGELVGHPLAGDADPEDIPAFHEVLNGLREESGRRASVHCRLRHSDGSWRVLSGSATNLLQEPSIGGIVLNWRDITEQSALESRLRDAQRMEAVGRLAGGIAHDLNNILTAVTSFSQFAADALPLGSAARDDIGQVEIAAKRATALTKQLLAFSRQQVLKPRTLNLNDVVTRLEPMLRRLIRADVALRTELAPGIAHILADPAQIEQVVLNLVLNARDAMPNGGAIVVKTSDVDVLREDARQHGGVKTGPQVMLSVTDSGFGMDEETKAHVFEPFFTTKAIGQGTGLGLATVYGIIKQSGGSISIQSEVGHGSVFEVFFPRHAGANEAPVVEALPALRELAIATVLLVEDDAAVQVVAKRALEGAGYTVHCASDGKKALLLADQLGASLDLVVTDLVMPEMGGQELALRLGERWPTIRILFMSGYAADASHPQLALRPQDGFIEKPFTPRLLADKAALVLRGAQRAPQASAAMKRSAL